MQHGESGWRSPCSLRIFVSKIGRDREISLRTQFINQLKIIVVDGGWSKFLGWNNFLSDANKAIVPEEANGVFGADLAIVFDETICG